MGRGKESSYGKETYTRGWYITFWTLARTRVRLSSLCARKEGRREKEGQTLTPAVSHIPDFLMASVKDLHLPYENKSPTLQSLQQEDLQAGGAVGP